MTNMTTEYKKRGRIRESDTVKTAKMNEDELVLRLTKDELLDKHVLLPHAEVNPLVYDEVNRFVERYDGGKMTLTIMCDSVSPITQNVFKESYHSHYEDEYQKITRYLKRRYLRVVGLIGIIILAFGITYALMRFTNISDFNLNVISQIGVFCLWEIGYTHYDRVEASAEKSRIVRAKDADIQFQC